MWGEGSSQVWEGCSLPLWDGVALPLEEEGRSQGTPGSKVSEEGKRGLQGKEWLLPALADIPGQG